MPSAFSSALSAAADASLASGQIDQRGHAVIASIAAGPSVNRAAVIQHFVAHSLGVPVGKVDWAAIIAQLQVMIPMIIQLIQLINPPKPPAPPVNL